jgi:acetyl esterase/lipase
MAAASSRSSADRGSGLAGRGWRRACPHRPAARLRRAAPDHPVYVHGGGWILGNAGTHDRLVRELAVGVNAAVAFVEYDRSPKARYPVAIEQAYATALWITRDGAAENLDASRLAVADDSVGGNMTAALAILAKQRGDVTFVHQSLYYPVTDAAQDTGSYREFPDGPYLRAASMAWFWDAYLPEAGRRGEITASPLRASVEQLSGLPETFLIVDENDVLRDEGEAYSRKAHRGRRADHERPLQRHHPRLHDAQPRPRDGRRHRRGRTGDPRPAQGPRPLKPFPLLSRQKEKNHEPPATDRRPRARCLRRIRQLEQRRRAIAGERGARGRGRQPAARPARRRCLPARRAQCDQRASGARRPLVRGHGDHRNRGRPRPGCRPGLRQRVRTRDR